MQIVEERLPNGFLIVPNLQWFFGEFRNDENCLDIIGTLTFENVADICLLRLGALGIRFLDDGPLRSIPKYRAVGEGALVIPDRVTENHDQLVELQGRRILFSNFIAAAIFGRISALRHMALAGAQYVGMDGILVCAWFGTELRLESSRYTDEIIGPKVRLARSKPTHVKIAKPAEIEEAIRFVEHIAERSRQFEHVDMQACMVMNYQAAILHNDQHSAASVALNFSVAEALVGEIFKAYGLVGDRNAKDFAKRDHHVAHLSNNKFRDLNFAGKIAALHEGGLMDFYLHQRLDTARNLRNKLMHRADIVGVREAGELQPAVRDLWSYLLDPEFELMTAWSMRI